MSAEKIKKQFKDELSIFNELLNPKSKINATFSNLYDNSKWFRKPFDLIINLSPYGYYNKGGKEFLKSKGYDGVKIDKNQLVVFDSNQIKSIDNAGSWTDSAGKITKEKPSDESAKHSYFNPQSPNILHSNEIWGGGLAGGTLNGLETDENGNIIGFDPAKFVTGFIAGAAGTKAVKLAMKNPNIRAKAQVMSKKGIDEGEIWDKTGWYLDKDGKWKFEINPQGGEFKLDFDYGDDEIKWSGKLSKFLSDDELFAPYPQLKDINLKLEPFKDNDLSGFYNKSSNIISLNNSLYGEQLKHTLYHEIQHAVQSIENFSQGGNVETAFKMLDKSQQRKLQQSYKDKAQEVAYNRLHGEVEARNVENRMQNLESLDYLDDTPEFDEVLKQTQSSPRYTQDTNIKDTILYFGDEKAMSVGDGKAFKADEVALNLPQNVSKMERKRLELFSNFIKNPLDNANFEKSFNFGKVSDENAQRLKMITNFKGQKQEFDLKGYSFEIDANDIRHIKNNHPDDLDLLNNLYDIYHNFDKAQWDITKDKRTGKNIISISFFKEYKDGTAKAVEVRVNENKKLKLKTLFRIDKGV